MILANPLERILNHAHDETLHLSFDEWHSCLDIEGKGHRHSLTGSVENAPRLELLAESDAPWYRFDTSHFCQALKQVYFAVSEEDRPLLRGVLFHRHGGNDRMVATDGRRLAMRSLASLGQPADVEGEFPMRVMPYPVCVKFIDVIESLGAKMCRLRFAKEHLSFECEDFSLRCSWPEKDYPDYLNILPNPKPPLRVQVNRETMIWALELIAASQREADSTLVDYNADYKAEFRVEKEQMILESHHPVIGHSWVRIPVQYDGPATSAFFDIRFIKEALLQTSATKVTFCFRPQEERFQSMLLELDEGFDYLVMPMIAPLVM